MANIFTFDPPSHAPAARKLTDKELTSVLTASGYGAGHAEANWELKPSRARGLWPDPGIYEVDARRDPIVATGLWRRATFAASLDVRVVDPPDATPAEQQQAQLARDMLASLPGGLAGLIRLIYTREQFGFSLLEKVWEVEEKTLAWRLEDLVWIHPMTVKAWGFSESGHMIGCWQKGSNGPPVWVPREKLAHFVRGDTGRNPEGVSALRPIHYYIEAKGDAIATHSASLHLFGEGWLDVTTDETRGQPEFAELESALQDWQEADRRYLIHAPGTEIEARYGGNVLPNLEENLRAYDHQLSRGLDESLQSLGTSAFGARAVGSEMMRATHRSLAGEFSELCVRIQQEVLQPIYERNGWDVTRIPTLAARSMANSKDDVDRARVMLEMVRDGVIPEDSVGGVTARALELLDV